MLRLFCGRHPAHQFISGLCHYLQGFVIIHPRWLAGFLNHEQYVRFCFKKTGMKEELRVQKAVRSDFSMEEVGMNSKLVKRFGGWEYSSTALSSIIIIIIIIMHHASCIIHHHTKPYITRHTYIIIIIIIIIIVIHHHTLSYIIIHHTSPYKTIHHHTCIYHHLHRYIHL